MIIEADKCISCGLCPPYCPLGSITMKDVAVIDQDTCVECGACFRSAVCPTDAFTEPVLAWPRSARRAFSNVRTIHKETRVPGRGTEEMKTNDVRGLYGGNTMGVACELGRPGVSSSFRDVERLAMAMAKIPGVKFCKGNPVTSNMTDVNTGKLKDELLNERTLSAIVECEVPRDQLPKVIDTLQQVAKEVDTVFSVDFVDRPLADGTIPMQKVLDQKGVKYYPNGKLNLGLGRPLIP